MGNFWEQVGVVCVLTAKQDHDFFAGIFQNFGEIGGGANSFVKIDKSRFSKIFFQNPLRLVLEKF